MLKKVLTFFVLLVANQTVFSQLNKNEWVDSVFQTLSGADQIGQLFMLPISANEGKNDISEFLVKLDDYHPGGILITGGGPESTVRLINKIQKKARVPLLVGIDAEWGPGQTIDSLIQFQKPLLVGSIAEDTLVYQMASAIANQLKALGIHINFALNADIDVLVSNPLIYYSDDKIRASSRSLTVMRGLRDNGILTFTKHSAHQGDDLQKSETQDSFMLNFVNNRLDTLSFYPYAQLLQKGADGIRTSHLHFSFIDKKKAVPAPVSQLFISDILKKQLGFKGLIATDIPYLQTIAGKPKGEIERMAFEMGNDMLINPLNINQALKKIEAGLKKNTKLKDQLENSVKKILAAKYDVGLNQKNIVDPEIAVAKINSPAARQLKEELTGASITIAKNEDGLIPIKTIDNKSFASISIGENKTDQFGRYLSKYAQFKNYSITTLSEANAITENLKSHDVIVVGLYSIVSEKREILNWLKQLSETKSVIVCSFGNPYDLISLESLPSIVVGYSEEEPIPMVMAQIIFGASQAKGTMPITITPILAEGVGQTNAVVNRLGYAIPESVGMDSRILEQIKSIVWEAIDSAATPGCNVIVAKNGKIVFEEAFGWKSYDRVDPMTENTIHDLASITKVAATLQTVMFMQERGLIDVNKKISYYLPELKNSNKKNFTIKNILTHQAGLWPYLPFWLQTMKDSTLLPEYYSQEQGEDFPFPVSEKLFASKSMKDSLWQWIIKAKVRDKSPREPYNYTYSDMGFYMLQHLAEKILNQPMQDFLAQNLYDPLGAHTTGYLPLDRFSPKQIAPTEIDLTFRKSKLVGYVHDQGAAMHGGIGGHAGLFSSASDLVKLGQMWLQKGSYGGIQYFKEETIDFFTVKQYETSRRGLGWDKPLRSEWNGPTSQYASPATFGHTGFTGTAIWVDPEFDLVFVFLSNRVHPDMFNTKLLSENIRPRIQDVIYQSIFEYCKRQN